MRHEEHNIMPNLQLSILLQLRAESLTKLMRYTCRHHMTNVVVAWVGSMAKG